jgi:hypothetical protein
LFFSHTNEPLLFLSRRIHLFSSQNQLHLSCCTKHE